MNAPTPHSAVPAAAARRPLATWVIAGLCAAGLAGTVMLIVSLRRSDSVPRLNSDTPTLAMFVATDAYTALPFQRQELYMKVMEERDDNGELKRAFTTGKTNEAAYRSSIQEAWLGQQLKRSEKYAVLPAGSARVTFIAELVDRKNKPSVSDAKTAGATRAPESEDEADLIKRDPTAAKLRMASWPPQVREQIEAFRRDYESARDAREAAAKPKPAPAVEP